MDPSPGSWAPASADYRVLTPERVSLRFDIAGVGSRGAALMVDTLLQAVLSIVLVLGIVALLVSMGVLEPLMQAFVDGILIDSPAPYVALAVLVIGLFVIAFGYFIFFEIIWNGQTPGKRLLGLRVMRENGYPIRAGDAVVRNLVRLVDSLPAGYAVGIIVMLLNSRARRLGDFAAGTIVVREGARMAALGPVAEVQGEGRLLSASDATLVRDFLLRRSTLDAPARAALAARLAESLSRRYALERDTDAERFLESLGV